MKSPGLNKNSTKANVDEASKQLEQAAIDKTPKIKSKNLDVVAEYERKQHKPAANFVVIGMPLFTCLSPQAHRHRPRGLRQKHADGPTSARPAGSG